MRPSSEITALLEMLDQAFDKKAWHGTNLAGAVRRVDLPAAAWRPHADRHNIAELVLHTAYWKYAVRRRLRGEKRGSFRLEGSNWFRAEPPELDEERWREAVALLREEHRLLREAVRSFPAKRLDERINSKHSFREIIVGAAAHDLYHTGQIQLLKKLLK